MCACRRRRIDCIPERGDTLMGFTVRRAVRALEIAERIDHGLFAARGERLAATLGYTESLAAAARALLRSPWRPEVKNFAWELVTGCLLVGPRGGAPTDDCAACGSVAHAGDITDSAAHVLTTCAVAVTLRHWAVIVIKQLAAGRWRLGPPMHADGGQIRSVPGLRRWPGLRRRPRLDGYPRGLPARHADCPSRGSCCAR